MKYLTRLLLILAAMWLAACSTTSSISSGSAMEAGAKWALLPLVNHTDTPQAALAAESLVEHQLRQRGLAQLTRYPATLSRDTLFEPSERRVGDEARKWAREQGVRYGVQGAVEEWRYKVGIDGEPAVGVTLQVIDLNNNDQVVWSASSARSGWSREALSAVATKVMENLVAGLPLGVAKP
jgi:TolB-like protein